MAAQPNWLITAEEFAALPLDGWRAELIRGEIVTMPAAFAEHGRTASRLNIIVGGFILANQLGESYCAETGFLVERHPDTVRALISLSSKQAARLLPPARQVGVR